MNKKISEIKENVQSLELIENLLNRQMYKINILLKSFWDKDFKYLSEYENINLPSCEQVGNDGFCMLWESNEEFHTAPYCVPLSYLIEIIEKKGKINIEDFKKNSI